MCVYIYGWMDGFWNWFQVSIIVECMVYNSSTPCAVYVGKAQEEWEPVGRDLWCVENAPEELRLRARGFHSAFLSQGQKSFQLSHSTNLSSEIQKSFLFFFFFSFYIYYSIGVSWHSAKSKSASPSYSRADPHPDHHRSSVQLSHVIL